MRNLAGLAVLVVLSACGGAAPVGPEEFDGSLDGSQSVEDAGPTQDSGHPLPDAGKPDSGLPVVDSGMPQVDAGQPDSGTPEIDAGQPDAGQPEVDAGTPPVDAGTPPVDAGQPDAGPACTPGTDGCACASGTAAQACAGIPGSNTAMCDTTDGKCHACGYENGPACGSEWDGWTCWGGRIVMSTAFSSTTVNNGGGTKWCKMPGPTTGGHTTCDDPFASFVPGTPAGPCVYSTYPGTNPLNLCCGNLTCYSTGKCG